MTKYESVKAEVEKKVADSGRAKGKPSRASSKTDLEGMMHALVNSPEQQVSNFVYRSTDDGNTPPVPEIREPVKRYRESLKSTVKSFGVDKLDADKLDTIDFPKEHAAATLELAMTAVQDYMKAGRKLVLPVTAPNETRMEIMMDDVPEKVTKSHFKSKDGSEGKETKTSARKIIKVKNTVPYWLKSKG